MVRGEAFPKRLAIVRSQIEQLGVLLPAVIGRNPFYSAKFEAAGVSYKVRDLGAFAESIPFTTKAEIVADQQAHPPYGTNLTFPLERYTRMHQTSGTSGAPLRWLDTAESWDWMLGNWQHVYRAAEVGRGHRIFFAFSFGPFLGFWTAFESAARVGALCFSGGGMSSAARLRTIFDNRCDVLCCTPTYAVRLAEVAAAEGIDLTASPVRLLVLAGEPGGSIPATRARLEQLWPGARVFDHHGMTEVGPVSYECPAKPGRLHLIETSYVAEVIDPQTHAGIDDGGTGELVLTTLGRVGSPLIRYRTGDLVQLGYNGTCECGRSEMAIEGGILGRVDDMVIVRGVNVYPSAVEQIITAHPEVAEFRVRVRTANALPELEAEVELRAGADAEAAARQLESSFETSLHLRVPVRIAAPNSVPRSEAKTKRFIRE